MTKLGRDLQIGDRITPSHPRCNAYAGPDGFMILAFARAEPGCRVALNCWAEPIMVADDTSYVVHTPRLGQRAA